MTAALRNMLLVPAFLCTVLSAGETISAAAMRRAADRQTRAKAIEQLPAQEKKAQGTYVTALAGVAQWLIGLEAKTLAEPLVKSVVQLDPDFPALAKLQESFDAVSTDKPLDEMKTKELETRLKQAEKTRAQALFELARSIYGAGLVREACVLTERAIAADPDNAAAQQALGRVRQGTGWTDAFSAQQQQKGFVKVPELGWVAAAQAEKIKAGEWFENGRWLPLDAADIVHSDANNPWVIETEHFVLRSTTSRKRSVALGEKLEGFWSALYREALPFFTRNERKGGAMAFTHAIKPKLQIVYHGRREDYEALVKREFKEPIRTVLLIFPGAYYQQKHVLYFDAGNDDDFLRPIFLQHELTRMILSEFTQGGNPAPRPWLVNAMAQNFIFVRANDAGRWYLPSGLSHTQVETASKMMMELRLPMVAPLLELDEKEFENTPPGSAEPRRQACGAFGRFLLEAENGAYAQDFCDLVHDSYRNPKVNPRDYLGDMEKLEMAFREYLTRR